MAEDYKLLYEQMKKIVSAYQDDVMPKMRTLVKQLEGNQIEVRCKECENWDSRGCSEGHGWCKTQAGYRRGDWYCADGKRATITETTKKALEAMDRKVHGGA